MVAISPEKPSSTTPMSRPFTNKQLPIPSLLFLATQGSADVCNLSHRIGSFKRGKAFDALIVSLRPDSGNLNVWGTETGSIGVSEKIGLERSLEQFLFCGDDRNISKVYVQGQLVGGKHYGGRS